MLKPSRNISTQPASQIQNFSSAHQESSASADFCYGRAHTLSSIFAKRIGQIFVALISFEPFAHIHNATVDSVNSFGNAGLVIHLFVILRAWRVATTKALTVLIFPLSEA
jgi:hypothetical protein